MGFRKSKKRFYQAGPTETELRAQEQAAVNDRAAQEAAKQAQERAQRQQQGRGYIDSAFGQFDDNYYNNLRESYSGFYDQSVQDQYKTQRDALTSQFGQTQGSQAFDYVKLFDSLDREYANKRGEAGSLADNYVSGVRSEVSSNKDALYSQNDQSADPNTVAQAANSKASSLRNRQFSPLGNVFANIKPATGASTAPSQTGGAVNYGSFASADSQFNPAAFNIAPVTSSRVVS